MSLVQIVCGDALEVLRAAPDNCVHCCVTSPPYHGLRDYGVEGQIGLEETSDQYVSNLVEVFREIRRVLRPDGTVWLNLGDCFARPRVGSNLTDCLDRSVKGQPVIFRNATSIRITPKGRNVALPDQRFPYCKLLSLFGVERITIKQRNNDFCQVLHTLATPSYCWIGGPLAWMARSGTHLEIVLDAGYDVSIIVSQLDTNSQPVLGVFGTARAGTAVDDNASFAIKKTSEPMAKIIANGQTIGNPVPFNTPLKRFPDIYLVDQSITLTHALDPSTGHPSDFRVAKATREEIRLCLGDTGVDLRSSMVAHLYAPNAFGSFVSYYELYDKAERKSNANRPKQELGIPDLVKRALMEDGWICRSTIIWEKPNCLPESVKDRPTKSHEQLFMLTKSTKYFYDQDAIREPTVSLDPDHPSYRPNSVKIAKEGRKECSNKYATSARSYNPAGRNKRSVWRITTQPLKACHFAPFPEALVEPCILAGTSEYGCCSQCRTPFRRVIERGEPDRAWQQRCGGDAEGEYHGHAVKDYKSAGAQNASATKARILAGMRERRTVGWRPSCDCYDDSYRTDYPKARRERKRWQRERTGDWWRRVRKRPARPEWPVAPSLVLDPFAGSGTTGLVAGRLGRRAILIDLNSDYCGIARQRCSEFI